MKPEQCYYHPAPLTKSRDATAPAKSSFTPSTSAPSAQTSPVHPPEQPMGLASPPSSNGTSRGDTRLAEHPMHVPSSLNLSPRPQYPKVVHSAQPRHGLPHPSSTYRQSSGTSMAARESRLGFLGPTSYSAIFNENPISLDTEVEEEDVPNIPPVTSKKIRQGAEVLALLRDLPLYEKFTERWLESSDGVIVLQPMYQMWLDDTWSEFGRLFVEGDINQLLSLSELVWRNTRQPLKLHGQMSAEEWAKSASGKNLRWEVVGIILSITGCIAVNLSDWDSIFDTIRDRYVDKPTFAERMRKASEFCQCFCYESEVLNDLTIAFMYEDLILVVCVKGEGAYVTWQRTGEVCDAIVAMGIHQGNYVDSSTPFWMSELRRKIFISAYGRDKSSATFLGRPPRLSYRYCKMEMPLDLNGEDIFYGGKALEAAVGALDPNGWNTTGAFQRTTWLRAWFQHCKIREEILEIALGSDDHDLVERTQVIRRRLDELHATYPAFMRLAPEDVLNQSERQSSGSCLNAIFLISVHAGVMHTEFLLQRALINRRKHNYKELIPISRQILSLVLLAQSKRDFFRDFQADLTYLLAVHGLPTAGVLAVELLKQEQSRQYTADVLPRSETIQDLSVFISTLALVKFGEGNYPVCNQGRRALRRILDQILSPNPLVATRPNGDPSQAQPIFDEMSVYFPTANDADFLQWLENVDWDKSGNWIIGGEGLNTPAS
nr:hypothetical protein CFP56_31496 [Quercus suber]